MRIFGALALVLSSLLISLLSVQTINAVSFDTDGIYRYEPANGFNYGSIVDSRGAVFESLLRDSWICVEDNNTLSVGSLQQKDISGDGIEEWVCPGDEPASYAYYNDTGGEISVIIVNGQAAAASDLYADQGFRNATFIRYAPGSFNQDVRERVQQIVINNGNSAARPIELNHIPFASNYQYEDDSFDAIRDSSGRRYLLYEGDDCPFESPLIARVDVVDSDDDLCEDARYFRNTNGNYTAFIVISTSRAAADNVDLEQARLAEFVSFDSSNRLYDYISLFEIDTESFFSGSEPFDDRCIQEVGVLSWILCPLVNFTIDKVVEPIQNVVLDILETDSLLTAPATGNSSVYIYNAWKQFRTIANALLAIAFVALIYLMVTTQSGNYSIQRTLPRLVVITIMIQVSYFIAAIMVDMGNVAAEGVASIFNNVREGALRDNPIYGSGSAANALPTSADFLTLNSLDRSVGAGLGVILAIMGAFFYTWFVPGVVVFLIFGLLISILGVFLALVLRQLIIVVLIVLAPLAFILGLFPATEKWMREWFDNLGKLIVIYPLVAVVFGAGSLLSYLALGTGESEVNMLIGSSIGLIVLFAIPALFTFAGRIFRGFTSSIQSMTARSKSAAQGDANNPMSWKSNINYNKAERQMQVYEKAGKALPISRRFLRPSWKSAQVFNVGAQRMQGVLSPTLPMNLRRLYWGNKPFKSLASYANWKPDHIAAAKDFEPEIKNVTRSTPMLFSTIDAALKDTGFLLDRGLNYTWGIKRMHDDGQINRGTAELMYQAFQPQVKGIHRIFFGFADTGLLLDHDYADPTELGGKWFAANLDQLGGRDRNAVFKARQSSLEDFGNAGDDRQPGSSYRYVARWLNDESFLDEMLSQPNNQRNINAIETLKLRADNMNAALNDPIRRRQMIEQDQIAQQAQGDDDDVRVSAFGQPGQAVRHREEFVKAAYKAYNYAQSRGATFTDEINEINY